MITNTQLDQYVKLLKTNETTVYREWIQILTLKAIYDDPQGNTIFFKGGTAIHFLFGAPRFSEDLDFTVSGSLDVFLSLFGRAMIRMAEQETIEIKERVTVTGKRFLITCCPAIIRYPIYLTLDFSFRERVLRPNVSPYETPFPVIFTSFIHHLSMEEIFAEKIRAILTRRKGRDLYDFWYLLNRGVGIHQELVREKLAYYRLSHLTKDDVLDRIISFPKKEFVNDLRPFIPIPERTNLADFYDYVQTQIKGMLSR